MTDEQLRGMAQACVTDIETCRSFSDQSEAVERHISPLRHAITEQRTGILRQDAEMRRWYSDRYLNPAQIDQCRRYQAEHLWTLSEVPTSPAALVAYLKTNVLTPAEQAA